MALEQIILKRETLTPDDEQFMERLNARLSILRKSDEKKFCDILYGIHKHYAPIVDKYLSNISAIISHTSGALKRIGLEMFLARVTSYGSNVYREIVAMKIKSLLQSKDCQWLALHIVNKVLPKMEANEISDIMPDVCAVASSKYADCRDVMYEIMIFVRETFSEKSLNRMATTVLLNGLNDIDAQLQRTIFTYWSQHKKLPLAIRDRIVRLFQDMYDPLAERNFVGYCSQLLLVPAIEHEESKRPILQDRNDADAKFYEYKINTNWRSQNTSLRAPLFTESQQRQIIGGEISSTQNYLRATADNGSLQFDPTIDPLAMQHRSVSFSLQSASSFLFSDVPQTLNRRSERIAGAPTASASTDQKSPFNRLRERILRDSNLMNRTMALKSIERKARVSHMQSQQHKSAAGQVILYRRYRFGDYPDFLINSLAFLLPLQALIRHDVVVARHVLVTIFQAICADIGPLKRQFLTSIGDCVKSIFAQTKQCDSMLFSALIEMALTDTQVFDIDTDNLVSVSNANNMMANGILLLEDRLNGKIATARCDTSSTTIDDERDHWIQLAKMYYNLSEFDIVAEIFADKLETDARLPKAIEYDSMCDYVNAKQLYMEIIGDDDDSKASLESDFVYQSLFRCVEKMGDWTELSRKVADQIDDADELWTDNWYKENLLPHYMRSGMRLLLQDTANDRQYVDNVERWQRQTDRADYMKTNFSESLMMLAIKCSDYLPARIFAESFFDRFLNDWNHISVLSKKMRTNRILEISKIAEIHKYCDLLLSMGRNADRNILEEFAARWDNTQMCATDPLQIWESVVAYRQYISSLVQEVIDRNDSIASHASTRLTESVFDMHFKLSDIALRQNNMALAKRTMEHIQKCIRRECDGKRSAQWNLLNAKCLVLQSQQATIDAAQSLDLLVDAWQQNVVTMTEHSAVLDANPNIYMNVMEQFAEIGESVLDRIGNGGAGNVCMQERLVELTQPSSKGKPMIDVIIFGVQILNIDLFSVSITERIYDRMCLDFKKSIELAEKCENSANRMFSTNFSVKVNGIGEMYNRFAMFCQQYNGIDGCDKIPLDVERNILVSVLCGMRFGSRNARLQFPRLLQLPNLMNTQLADEFGKQVKNAPFVRLHSFHMISSLQMEAVPEWMFISWVPQILSHFTFASACFLDALVIRLAKKYPSALLYPFQLAHSEYQTKHSGQTSSRSIVLQILELLRNPVTEKFIASLECLNLPEKKLQFHLNRISVRIRTNEQYTNEEYHSQLEHTIQIVFEHPLRGRIVNQLQAFRPTVDKLMLLNRK